MRVGPSSSFPEGAREEDPVEDEVDAVEDEMSLSYELVESLLAARPRPEPPTPGAVDEVG